MAEPRCSMPVVAIIGTAVCAALVAIGFAIWG